MSKLLKSGKYILRLIFLIMIIYGVVDALIGISKNFTEFGYWFIVFGVCLFISTFWNWCGESEIKNNNISPA